MQHKSLRRVMKEQQGHQLLEQEGGLYLVASGINSNDRVPNYDIIMAENIDELEQILNNAVNEERKNKSKETHYKMQCVSDVGDDDFV